MKLAYFETGSERRWGVLDPAMSSLRVIGGRLGDWAPPITEAPDERSLSLTGEVVPLARVRLLPPMERGNKILVVGANYRTHLKDFKLGADTQPIVFMKPFGALVGATDPIRYSPLTSELDFEVELVVVFGAPLRAGRSPMHSVLGYTIGNDVSARDLQPGSPGIGMDLLSAKGLDGATPVGPWIVTRDEFGDASPDISMALWVNGERRQNGRTSGMTWDVARLAAHVDARTTIEPGDIMFTGTLPGVAQGDGRFLADGDMVEAEIERIGTLRNVVRRPPGYSVSD